MCIKKAPRSEELCVNQKILCYHSQLAIFEVFWRCVAVKSRFLFGEPQIAG